MPGMSNEKGVQRLPEADRTFRLSAEQKANLPQHLDPARVEDLLSHFQPSARDSIIEMLKWDPQTMYVYSDDPLLNELLDALIRASNARFVNADTVLAVPFTS